jgi:hypothetical protein
LYEEFVIFVEYILPKSSLNFSEEIAFLSSAFKIYFALCRIPALPQIILMQAFPALCPVLLDLFFIFITSQINLKIYFNLKLMHVPVNGLQLKIAFISILLYSVFFQATPCHIPPHLLLL